MEQIRGLLAWRYTSLWLALGLGAAGLILSIFEVWFLLLGVTGFGLAVIGVRDLRQDHHSILRNYPILAHMRFFFESIRPEIRQYLLESDTEKVPFSRNQRSLVYQRAKREVDNRPFGTQLDVYETGHEWINHSISPAPKQSPDFRITIGPDCAQPYSASIFNISAMSFGSLSANAVRALNEGARLGGFAHDTGEGSISRYHRERGGDLIWELGSGYFGCRNADGTFDPEKFAEQARTPQVKMIEVKLSQGAKPGHGGVLPGRKVTPEIAEARGVPVGVECVSPAAHSAFSSPIELLHFLAKLRELSGGKPTGFKLCIGHPWEFLAVAKAMLETGLTPDFIVVDGSEGGTGAAPIEFTDHIGMPMREGLMFVHNTLVGVGLRDRVRIGASGKIVSAFDIARAMALGADWCNSARGFMFALGCIQAQACHTGRCPTGVTTQDPIRQAALDVSDKSSRVRNFHHHTLEALSELTAAAGLTHPSQLLPAHLVRRTGPGLVRSAAEMYRFLTPQQLLKDPGTAGDMFSFWPNVTGTSFSLELRQQP
jgi:glutamate synthase domain-containing protein 2